MIEIIDTQNRLEDIKPAWEALADVSQSPLLSHAWIASSAKAFARIATPAIFVLWDGYEIDAAAPLGLFRDGLTDRLHFIGYLLREPNNLLYRNEVALRDLVTQIFSHARPFSMARIASSGVEERVLQAACPRGTLMLRAQTGVTHAALLPASIEALDIAMSSSARSSFRRKLKRARALGEVTFTVDRPRPGTVSEIIDELIRIEASGWKGRMGTAIAFDPALKTFFRRQMWQACCRHHGRPPEGYRDSHSQMPGDPIASAAIFEAASDHRRATAAKGSIIAGSRLIGTWLRSAPSGDQAPIERVPRLAL